MFQAQTGANSQGDMAVDDIALLTGACPGTDTAQILYLIQFSVIRTLVC